MSILEFLWLVQFKLWGSWQNTFHVSPSQSVRLQWTEGPSSSALRSAQLCPILHLRLQVIEHYQFWQLPRATGIWVLPPFTHPAPQKHTRKRTHIFLYCLCLKRMTAENERRNKSCQSIERNRELRISVVMLRTMGYFVPSFIIGLCLIWNRQLITLKTTSQQHWGTAVSWKQSPRWNCLIRFLVQLLNSIQIVLDATGMWALMTAFLWYYRSFSCYTAIMRMIIIKILCLSSNCSRLHCLYDNFSL